MLKNFEPLVKPVVFMGQSAAKGAKGISQKQQLEVMCIFSPDFIGKVLHVCQRNTL